MSAHSHRAPARPRRLPPAGVALLLVVSGLAAAAALPHAHRAGAGSGNVLRRWAATMGGGHDAQQISKSQAVTDAKNYDMIVGHPKTFKPYVAAMRAANPQLKLIAYLNGMYLGSGHAAPDSWYARDKSGNKVRSRKLGNYLMNPSNSLWASDRTKLCAAEIKEGAFDGCYLDMLGTATLSASYVTGLPVNPATKAVWTTPAWIAATAKVAAKVQANLPTRIVVGNGLGQGSLYFAASQGPTSKLLTGIQGGNAQGWLRGTDSPVNKFRSEDKWRQDVDMLVDAGSHGKSVLTMTKLWVNATSAQKEAWHLYALASFLLGTNGHQYFFFSTAGAESADAEDTPYDHIDVGTPTDSYRVVNGAFLRHFTNGLAVVNPTGSKISVSLGAKLRNADGQTMASVTLGPNSGQVFTG